VHVPDVFEAAARGQPAADGDGVHVLLARGGAVRAVERDAAAELRGLVLRGGRARDVRRADRGLPLWGERFRECERGDHAARFGDDHRIAHARRDPDARPEPPVLRRRRLQDVIENLERPALFLAHGHVVLELRREAKGRGRRERGGHLCFC